MQNKKRTYPDYYIGIDAGTDSVGWAATNESYELLKFGKKAMWGIRLFDEALPAADRRTNRTQRRRYGRRAQRTKLLQELFSEAIVQKDPGFFIRMSESKYLPEDRTQDFKYTLFNDVDYTDKQFHKDYPTAYHLRDAFVRGENITDPRLLYLAVHHIIIHRGHFLFDGVNASEVTRFDTAFDALRICIEDNYDADSQLYKLLTVDTDELQKILKSKTGITDKKKALNNLFGEKKGSLKAVAELLAGSSGVKLSELFENDSIEDTVSFSGSAFADNHDSYENTLEDNIVLLDCLKAIYDWSVLTDVLGEHAYICSAKAADYEKHKSDLKLLKSVIREHCGDECYYDFFKSSKNDKNYCAYSGMCKIGHVKRHVKSVSQDDFYKEIRKILKPFTDTDDNVNKIMSELDAKTFLPKQLSPENCAIPYQLNELELKKILSNAEVNFPFLTQKEGDGLTVSDKILKLLTFRIPYYVGPLNDAHKSADSNCWIVRRTDSKERITPWNFEKEVDTEKCAEAFIRRMTNKCTYIYGEDVLPKNSLLYSEYEVLNELSNIRIKGEPVSVDDKQGIINEVFKSKAKVRVNDILKYYTRRYGEKLTKDDLTGLASPPEFKSSLKSYIDFAAILTPERFSTEYVEHAILAVLLFSQDKKMLTSRLKKIGGGYFTDEEIKRIANKKYSDWGRLSSKLLTGVYSVDPETGEYINIITAMRTTQLNFMQVLEGQYYSFREEVNKLNEQLAPQTNEFSYDALVKDLYVSPKIKRSIWQTLIIVREIVKVTGHAPKKIFIEMARGTEGNNKTPDSRKKQLLDCYKKCGEDVRELRESLEGHSDSDLRRTALYLYYTQMGRCMYSGEPIELADLSDRNLYDIDHIYPQSKTKDDSLDNKVLVKKSLNLKKSDSYPIPNDVLNAGIKDRWKGLLNAGLISKEKYFRLTRRTELTADELAGFINRQLVETRQSTKATAEILKKLFPDTAVVYAKATNADVFKKHYDIPKVREVNDYHHARDAYINIVVGNVFDVKFTRDPVRFIKSGKRYSLNECMYDYPVGSKDAPAWVPENKDAGTPGTIKTVKNVLSRENILYTRMPYTQGGALFDVQLVSKGSGQLPAKPGDIHTSGQPYDEIIRKYGGYNKIAGAYFCLVEHSGKKNERIRSIEYVPVYLADKIEHNPELLDDYVSNTLGLKNPDIRIRKIKINSLFNYNGFLMNISGRKNNRLIFKPAVQLKLESKDYKYLKNIVKFHNRQIQMKYALTVSDFDDITVDDNIRIYDTLLSKLTTGIYNKKLYNAPINTLTEQRKKFISLSIENQSELIYNILHLFQCNSVLTNLSLVSGPKSTGEISILKDIVDKILLIYQSPTGLFENSVDLLTV